jgi:hypothetical protein
MHTPMTLAVWTRERRRLISSCHQLRCDWRGLNDGCRSRPFPAPFCLTGSRSSLAFSPLPTGHECRCEDKGNEDAEAEDEGVGPHLYLLLDEGTTTPIISGMGLPAHPSLGVDHGKTAPADSC